MFRVQCTEIKGEAVSNVCWQLKSNVKCLPMFVAAVLCFECVLLGPKHCSGSLWANVMFAQCFVAPAIISATVWILFVAHLLIFPLQ